MHNLLLLTNQYPFGSQETFLEAELPVLSQHFHVTLVPAQSGGTARELPASVSLIVLPKPHKGSNRKAFYRHFWLVLRILVSDWHRSRHLAGPKRLKFIKQSALELAHVLTRLKQLSSVVATNSFHIGYSYWLNNNALLLTLVRKYQNPKMRCVARVHGFDLYNQRAPFQLHPHREYVTGNLSALFAISAAGRSEILAEFPELSKRIFLAPLGTPNPLGANPLPSDSRIHVITVANALPVKRLDRLLDALALLKQPYHWHYFGDGPLRSELEARAKELGLSHSFYGRVENRRIHEFYTVQPISVHVLPSDSEGAPVSVMEAMSYGVPTVAFEVGGLPEMVNCRCGILLPPEAGVVALSDAISRVAHSFSGPDERAAVSAEWKKKFQATTNYSVFCEMLSSLAVGDGKSE